MHYVHSKLHVTLPLIIDFYISIILVTLFHNSFVYDSAISYMQASERFSKITTKCCVGLLQSSTQNSNYK